MKKCPECKSKLYLAKAEPLDGERHLLEVECRSCGYYRSENLSIEELNKRMGL